MNEPSEMVEAASPARESAKAARKDLGADRRWLEATRRAIRSRIGITFLIFLIVNVILLAGYLWSRGGQTMHVRVEARGDEFTAYVDGQLKVQTRFDAPAQGGIVLALLDTYDIPSLPKPRGIDYVRVTDLASGEVLFEDDFSSGYDEAWTKEAGVLTSDDGVLGTRRNGRLVLAGGWSDYAVDVSYRNTVGGSIMLRAQGSGNGVTYGFRPFRHYDNGFVLREQGEAVSDARGARLEVSRGETLKSLVAMTLSPYPLILLLLAVAFVAVANLQFADALGVPFRLPRIVSEVPWLAATGALALAAFGVTLFLNYVYGDRLPHVPDAVAYLFQAKVLASGRLSVPPPPVAEAFEFFYPPLIVVSDGKWAGAHPFGHPLALAVGIKLGAVWLIPPLLGAASVALTCAIGRKIFNARVGLLAAVLLAASPFFFMTASNFMSHNTAAFYLLASLFFLVVADKRPLLYGVLAGLFFGLLFNTRPLPALGLMAPFGLLLLSRLFPSHRRTIGARQAGGFIAGGLVMLVAYFLYNYATTGDALGGGFQAAVNADQTFGFGGSHSVSLGIQNEQVQMAFLLLVLNGWPQYIGLTFVLLPFILATRHRWDWFLLACAVLVIGVYTLFIGNGIMHGPRYWYPATPLLMLLAARGAERAAELLADAAGSARGALTGVYQRPQWAGLLVVYALVAALVGASLYGWLLSRNSDWRADFVPERATALQGFNNVNDGLAKAVDEADLDNALVLVEPCRKWWCYGSVFWKNSPTLDGDVVFAEDLETRRAELFQAYPDRAVYLGSYTGASVVPLGAVVEPAGTDESAELPPAPFAGDIALQTPTPTRTPPPLSTPDLMEVLQRDNQRQRDLAAIAAGLQRYYDRQGAYPVAQRIQSFCRFPADVGCQVAEVLDPLPQDPVHGRFYYYQSDETAFTLFALMESTPPLSDCPDLSPRAPIEGDNLYCLQGRAR